MVRGRGIGRNIGIAENVKRLNRDKTMKKDKHCLLCGSLCWGRICAVCKSKETYKNPSKRRIQKRVNQRYRQNHSQKG